MVACPGSDNFCNNSASLLNPYFSFVIQTFIFKTKRAKAGKKRVHFLHLKCSKSSKFKIFILFLQVVFISMSEFKYLKSVFLILMTYWRPLMPNEQLENVFSSTFYHSRLSLYESRCLWILVSSSFIDFVHCNLFRDVELFVIPR